MGNELDELAERLMELPRLLVKEQQRISKVITAMIHHQIAVTQLICNLHGIEHKELEEVLSKTLDLIEEANDVKLS